jgi:hypothetical protein
MYGNGAYFYNQEAMNKHQGFDEQQPSIPNSFYPQAGYPMQMSYYGFPYGMADRGMYPMQMNQIDPAFYNMYMQWQQQGFYPGMPTDPNMSQYTYPNSNVNYKK